MEHVSSEFIEFTLHSEDRLRKLHLVVLELQRAKEGDGRTADHLQSLLDEEALAHFHWPSPVERARRVHDLETRPVIETPTEESVGQRWDFDSMAHAIMESEYDLLGCAPSGAGKAHLRFRALAYPYGGVGALVALVEAFGFSVTGIDDGTGYIAVTSTSA